VPAQQALPFGQQPKTPDSGSLQHVSLPRLQIWSLPGLQGTRQVPSTSHSEPAGQHPFGQQTGVAGGQQPRAEPAGQQVLSFGQQLRLTMPVPAGQHFGVTPGQQPSLPCPAGQHASPWGQQPPRPWSLGQQRCTAKQQPSTPSAVPPSQHFVRSPSQNWPALHDTRQVPSSLHSEPGGQHFAPQQTGVAPRQHSTLPLLWRQHRPSAQGSAQVPQWGEVALSTHCESQQSSVAEQVLPSTPAQPPQWVWLKWVSMQTGPPHFRKPSFGHSEQTWSSRQYGSLSLQRRKLQQIPLPGSG
jgi:hypothetical protein